MDNNKELDLTFVKMVQEKRNQETSNNDNFETEIVALANAKDNSLKARHVEVKGEMYSKGKTIGLCVALAGLAATYLYCVTIFDKVSSITQEVNRNTEVSYNVGQESDSRDKAFIEYYNNLGQIERTKYYFEIMDLLKMEESTDKDINDTKNIADRMERNYFEEKRFNNGGTK